jgi:DNA-binding NarL/FixJ family response regulator
LVAGGLSNEEIAAQFVLSVRTVEHHVASIYAKIGVSGRSARAAAAAYALRHGLT